MTFFRVLHFAWQSFWRNIWLSLATVTIIILAFLAVNILIVVNVVTDSAIDVLQDKIDVSIYFHDDVLETQVFEVQTFLSALPQVSEITYISQQTALDAFREKHQTDTTIISSLDELSENPLSASLTVKAKNIADYPEIVALVDDSTYADLIAKQTFDNHREFIDRFKEVSDNITKVGVATSLVFVIVALLIVLNTIRVAIYTHRQEITIMKLVGATNWFIRAPFVIESALYGAAACIIAFILFYPLLGLIQPYIATFFSTTSINVVQYFRDNFLYIFGLELLIVIILTSLSSVIAVRRYLRI